MSVTSYSATPFTSVGSSGCESFSYTNVEGYEFEFDPPLDAKYECPICVSYLREPRQTKCGHRFCQDCILRWLRESGTCPVDNETLSAESIYPDNFAKREIQNCIVKCPNHKQGCQSKVVLCQIMKHFDECALSLKPCPNNCASILPQKEMKEHLDNLCRYRLISCHFCHDKLRADNLASHVMRCLKATIRCQYCGVEIKRDERECHIRDICQKAVLPCPFHFLGCDYVNERSKENDHLMAEIPSHMKQLSHIMSCLLHQLGDMSQNGIKQNLSNSALVDEVSRNLSHLKVSHPSLGMSLKSNVSESTIVPFQEQRNWPNPRGQLPKSVGDPSHNVQAIPPSTGLSQVSYKASHPLSFPLTGNTDPHHEMLGKLPPASAPQSASENPGRPFFANNSPPVPFTYHDNGIPVLPVMDLHNHSHSHLPLLSGSNHLHNHNNRPVPSASNHLHNHSSPSVLSASNNLLNAPLLPSPEALSDTLIGRGRPCHQSKGEEQINSFINTLKERCFRQTEQQQILIEHLYDQLCEVRRRNQELVKKMKDLESQSLHYDTRSHCGDYYWRISDYGELKKKANSGETTILHSGPFLTSPWGYKLCIRANFNGPVNNDGEHYLSLFIHFMQGSNDPLLRWPFKGQIILSVIDQNETYSERQHITETLEAKPQFEAFKQPTNARNHKGFGFTEFVTLSNLEQSSFIRNNTIIIRAHVFPEN